MKILLTTCLFMLTILSFGQSKIDVITKKDGQDLKVNIVSVNGDNVVFKYPNETATYTLPKNDIFRVVFSSGRVEVFHKTENTNSQNAQPESKPTSQNRAPTIDKEIDENSFAAVIFIIVEGKVDLVRSLQAINTWNKYSNSAKARLKPLNSGEVLGVLKSNNLLEVIDCEIAASKGELQKLLGTSNLILGAVNITPKNVAKSEGLFSVKSELNYTLISTLSAWKSTTKIWDHTRESYTWNKIDEYPFILEFQFNRSPFKK